MRRQLFPYKEVVYEKERKEYHHSFDAFSKKTKVGEGLLRASKSSSSSSFWWSCDAIKRRVIYARKRESGFCGDFQARFLEKCTTMSCVVREY
jgi:hypothetical protein